MGAKFNSFISEKVTVVPGDITCELIPILYTTTTLLSSYSYRVMFEEYVCYCWLIDPEYSISVGNDPCFYFVSFSKKTPHFELPTYTLVK